MGWILKVDCEWQSIPVVSVRVDDNDKEIPTFEAVATKWERAIIDDERRQTPTQLRKVLYKAVISRGGEILCPHW